MFWSCTRAGPSAIASATAGEPRRSKRSAPAMESAWKRGRSSLGAPEPMPAVTSERARFQADSIAGAERFERLGSAAVAEAMALGPARVQLQNKDLRGWEEEKRYLAEHSAKGAALTLRGYQATRPSLYDLKEPLERSTIPTLIIAGDEDEPCLDASLWLKRTMPYSGLALLPKTGHCVNLEEPDLFNRLVLDFLTLVEQEKWGKRDPRTLVTAPFGQDKK